MVRERDVLWHIGINPFHFQTETAHELTFEGALAELINYLWQDLTEEEQNEIKRVLE